MNLLGTKWGKGEYHCVGDKKQYSKDIEEEGDSKNEIKVEKENKTRSNKTS